MSAENSQDNPKRRKLSSFSYDKDVPSETLTAQNVSDLLENLDKINDIHDIENIQKKLQSDYKLLAREFGNSRLSRVETFISKIEDLQNQLKKNTIAHDTFVRNSLPQLDKSTSMEVDSLTHSKSLKRKQYYGDESISNGHGNSGSSPPPETPLSPPLKELPIFTESFEKILEPYRYDLNSLKNQYAYEAKLIEDSTRRNVELTWRQNIKDRMELKKKLRDQISNELIELDKDYNNDTRFAKVSRNEKRFRTSTRKVGEKKTARFASLDISREVETRVRRFHNSFSETNKPVSSAQSNEIDYDLELMKSSDSEVKIEIIESNYLYQEQPLKKETIGPTTMTDLVNSEIEERGVAGMQFQVATERVPFTAPGQNFKYNAQMPPPPPPPQLLLLQQQQQQASYPSSQYQSQYPSQALQPPYPQFQRHGFSYQPQYYQNTSPYQTQQHIQTRQQGQYPVYAPYRQ